MRDKVGGEVLGDAVGEIVLARIAGEILKGRTTIERRGGGGFFRLRGRRESRRRGGRADFKRIDTDRLGDVLELRRAKIGHGQIEPLPFTCQ